MWFHPFVLSLSYIGNLVISLKFSPIRRVISNRDSFFLYVYWWCDIILPVLSIIAWSCDWLMGFQLSWVVKSTPKCCCWPTYLKPESAVVSFTIFRMKCFHHWNVFTIIVANFGIRWYERASKSRMLLLCRRMMMKSILLTFIRTRKEMQKKTITHLTMSLYLKQWTKTRGLITHPRTRTLK